MAFFACGEAFIEVIISNRIPLAGIFSRVVANASAEDNNVVSTPKEFNSAATIFRTSSLSATTTHVALPIDSYLDMSKLATAKRAALRHWSAAVACAAFPYGEKKLLRMHSQMRKRIFNFAADR